jgi:PAS domain S-box-containing protein
MVGLATLFGAIAVGNIFWTPKATAVLLIPAAAGVAILLLGLRLASNRIGQLSKWTHAVAGTTALLTVLYCLGHLFYVPDPRQTTNLMLVAMGVGFLLFSRGWLIGIFTLMAAGWIGIVRVAPASPDWIYFGFALLGSMIFAGIMHLARVHQVRRQTEHREQKAKNHALATALKESEQAYREADKARGQFEKAAEAAKRNERRYRALFDNVPAGIYRVTPEGKLLAANAALVKMLGYVTAKELLSVNVKKQGLLDAEARARFEALLERHGKVRGYETAWICRDGTALYVRENANAVRDAEGRVKYYEGTIEDITDRKRAEAALKKQARELAQTVRALEQAKKDAEAATRAKGDERGHRHDESAPGSRPH